ncbi:endoribonuclease L-PSP [Nocardiopsis gilva YIM 90087]|uniref:Endoribonuclease L-PSP n=1 Tax=Nocardiopsis gilva YIM 90087 TaxID=1235441 RepID=A0A223SCQ1_9ACTN|nr:Rid family hydrolase [Nocardiopsis gilva]ASU85865.1 endoribonuclease L-PSP [Nocardiopsis gilva YIM 90087]
MAHTVVNPSALHDPTPFGYSHVVSAPAGRLVFVAGQYGSDTSGQVAEADFAAQVDRSFANMRTALDAAGVDFSSVVQLRTFIVDHDADKLAVLVENVQRIWGEQPPTQTLLGVASLALPGMLFEVDAIAVRA